MTMSHEVYLKHKVYKTNSCILVLVLKHFKRTVQILHLNTQTLTQRGGTVINYIQNGNKLKSIPMENSVLE